MAEKKVELWKLRRSLYCLGDATMIFSEELLQRERKLWLEENYTALWVFMTSDEIFLCYVHNLFLFAGYDISLSELLQERNRIFLL